MPVARHRAPPAAIGDQGALVGHVAAVAQRQVGLRQRAHLLFHGVRLAGESSLLDPELDCLDQA
jgi:hypothetical protein